MCVCVFRGMQKRCINESGKGGWSNKRRNVRLESADGCNGDAVDIRNNYSWQIEAAAGVEVKKTKQVESASHQSTNPQLYVDTTFQHVDLDSK